ncbi:MAG: hypothetical protein MK108_10320 [Mariniblastus sp.]|nr:hypothetical protein [Mariniblastus sp.]
MKNIPIVCSLGLILGIVVGCSSSETVTAKKSGPQLDNTPYLLNAEPEGSLGVKAARESVKDKEAVVIVGRIGGALNPWVDNRAAFQIVDTSLKACSDDKPEGAHSSCPTPWDYCCESDKLPTSMALVQFSDQSGSVVKQDARSLFNLTELQTVVVQGVAKRDDAGNLTIVADKMFVKK